MYVTQTIETPITTSLLNRHRTPKRTQSTEMHKTANPLKLPSSLGNWYTQTVQPREALRPLSSLIKSIETCNSPSPLKHPPVAPPFRILFNKTNYINNLSPPTPNRKKTTTHAKEKNTTNIEWVSTGLSSRFAPPPAFLSSFFAMQHLKHLNGISLVGRWLPDNVCWLGYGMSMSCTII